MLPFEFVVEGTPVSLQTNNNAAKSKWKEKVLDAARILWPLEDTFSSANLQVTIIYLYDKIAIIDVDNMLKPIIDALTGLVYFDDRQITDIIGRKREFHENFLLGNIPQLVTENLPKRVEFVYVKVETALDPRSFV